MRAHRRTTRHREAPQWDCSTARWRWSPARDEASGAKEAILLAAEGAKVVVNDVGAGLHGEGGGDAHPAQEVVGLIEANGGEAVVNGDDISTWSRRERRRPGHRRLRLARHPRQQRGDPARPRCPSTWTSPTGTTSSGSTSRGTSPRPITPPSTGATAPRRARTSSAASSTPRRRRGVFGNAGQANYAAAKAGIAALTWVEARELGRYGVTSNAIAPRARTRMTETIFGGDGMSAGEGGFDVWDPKNIANVVAFLAAPPRPTSTGRSWWCSAAASTP